MIEEFAIAESGVGHEDRDWAEFVFASLDHRFDGRLVRDIPDQGDRLATHGTNRLDGLGRFTNIVDGDIGSFGGQRFSDRRSDPSRCA